MKNNQNTLRKYINKSSQKYNKETLNGLFRSILEPVFSNPTDDMFVFLRLLNPDDKNSLLKRFSVSSQKVYSYSDKLINYGINNSQKHNIWENIEFLVVYTSSCSVCLIWDESLTDKNIPVYLSFNSDNNKHIVNDLLENSINNYTVTDLKIVDSAYLNSCIHSIVSMLNDKNIDLIISDSEKNSIIESNDTLQTANIVAEKAKFVAHEIKNNLSIINLYTTILSKRIEKLSGDEANLTSINNALLNISNASENVSSFVNDLRCVSSPYITEISLKNLISKTIMLCEEKANNAHVKIKIVSLDESVIQTDKTKVQCALMNIIYNAIEACTEDCIIQIKGKLYKHQYKITISNNGAKIPDNIKSRIFEQEFTTKEKGNGIGLSICKTQLKLINADMILVSSDENETVFEIDLPLK